LKKFNELLTYAVTLDLFIVAYVQFMTMLTELKKVESVQITLNANNLKQGLFVCVARHSQSYQNELFQKLRM